MQDVLANTRALSVALCTQLYTNKQSNKKQTNKKTNKQTNKQKTWLDYLLTKYTALFLRVGGNWVSGCSSPAWVRTTNRTRQSPFSRKFRICDMFSSWLVILDHLSGFTCVVITIYKKWHTSVCYQGCIDHFCRPRLKAAVYVQL